MEHDNAVSDREADYTYTVRKIDGELQPDCNCAKPEWQECEYLSIVQDNGWEMKFMPKTSVKLLYSDRLIYVLFHVDDRYVRCGTNRTNGEVWREACVEMFFAPSEASPSNYFSLEINCAGAIRLGYHVPGENRNVLVDKDDIGTIKLCQSLSGIIETEIETPIAWIMEVAVPLRMLEKYSPVDMPRPGVTWRANFQKCAENNSHPHWLSWAPIDSPEPKFHLPEYFGTIEFT